MPGVLLPGVFLLASVMGCARQAAAPAESMVGQAATTPDASQCELGREHWRTNASPKRGGTLVITSTGVDHLDVTAGGRNTVGPQVYNSLVEYRGCFPEDVALKPSLAQSWDISADGLTWTFHLRNDVRWHDKAPVNGRAFTSGDVAWTIEHQKVQGLLGSLWKPAEHTEPDASTVVLQLKAPDPDFPGQGGAPPELHGGAGSEGTIRGLQEHGHRDRRLHDEGL